MKKKLAAVFSAALLCLVLAGCGKDFSAADLLQANLDLLYKGECSDIALKDLALSSAEAQQMYQDGLNNEAANFAAYFDINLDLLPADAKTRLTQLCGQICQLAEYKVGAQNKITDGYSVELIVQPLDIMQRFADEDAEAVTAAWQAKMDSGQLDKLTDAEHEAVWAEGILQAISARAAAPTYQEEQTLHIKVIKDTDGAYIIDDEDWQQVIRLLIPY